MLDNTNAGDRGGNTIGSEPTAIVTDGENLVCHRTGEDNTSFQPMDFQSMDPASGSLAFYHQFIQRMREGATQIVTREFRLGDIPLTVDVRQRSFYASFYEALLRSNRVS